MRCVFDRFCLFLTKLSDRIGEMFRKRPVVDDRLSLLEKRVMELEQQLLQQCDLSREDEFCIVTK